MIEKRIVEIAELREGRGWSCGRIARHMACSESLIRWYCLQHGIEKKGSPAGAPGPSSYTADEDRQLLDLERQGLNYSQIAKRMQRVRSSVLVRLRILAREQERAESA